MATLTTLDLLIIIGYLLVLAGIGSFFFRRQSSLETFLIGGGRMSWLPVGLSLMAALNSGCRARRRPRSSTAPGAA